MEKPKAKIFQSFEEMKADEFKSNIASYDPEITKKSYEIFRAMADVFKMSVLKKISKDELSPES